MNNIAAASILLPAVAGAARRAEVSPSRLMMPLAFGTLLGGMATLLTTTNIIVSGLLRDHGLRGYRLLDFAPLGLPLIVAGVGYMALWGRHLLPARPPAGRLEPLPQEQPDLVGLYRLSERLFRARVPAGSYLIDKPLARSTFRDAYGLNVVAIERNGQLLLSPSPALTFRQGDIVLLEGKLEDFRRKDVEPYLEILPPSDWHERDLESPAIAVLEAVLAPRSSLIGQTLRAAHFREKCGFTVLAIWRAGRPIRTGLSDLALQFGDALLLQGPRERLPLLRAERDLILLAEEEEVVPVPGRGWLAAGIMALSLLLAALGLPLEEVLLGGALGMLLSGVLLMDQAYRAIDWKAIFVVAGMLPASLALTKTGAAALLADGLVGLLGPAGPLALLAGLFALAALLTQAIHGAAVAAMVAPIAIQASQALGVDPRALAMGVALATSMCFLLPLGHPVNVLAVSAGGYSFRDFLRVGWPLTLILFALVMLLLPLLWPLTSR
jgi:di/tricarboxylate transporter